MSDGSETMAIVGSGDVRGRPQRAKSRWYGQQQGPLPGDDVPVHQVLNLGEFECRNGRLVGQEELSGRWSALTVDVVRRRWREPVGRGETLLVGDPEAGVVFPPGRVLAVNAPGDGARSYGVRLLVDSGLAAKPRGECAGWWNAADCGSARSEVANWTLRPWGLDLCCPRCRAWGRRLASGELDGSVACPHSKACSRCGLLWGGAPMLDDARVRAFAESWRTTDPSAKPIDPAYGWLNSLLEGIAALQPLWTVRDVGGDWQSGLGSSVTVVVEAPADHVVDLEYWPDGGRPHPGLSRT